jgi:hypothetical protein
MGSRDDRIEGKRKQDNTRRDKIRRREKKKRK